jgi:hypothetical protein
VTGPLEMPVRLRIGDTPEATVGTLATETLDEVRPALARLLREVADEIENGERL